MVCPLVSNNVNTHTLQGVCLTLQHTETSDSGHITICVVSAAWSHSSQTLFPIIVNVIDFDVWSAVVFHVLRDGIVARFVATDGGITRVYPRRYSSLFRLSFTCSVKSGIVKQHSKLWPNIWWCKCVRRKWIQTVMLLGWAPLAGLLTCSTELFYRTWRIRHF